MKTARNNNEMHSPTIISHQVISGPLPPASEFATSLAWETEVWIASNPDHMIHLNGDRFMGPR